MIKHPAVRVLLAIVKFAVIAACFAYIGLTIARNADSLRQTDFDLRPLPLILSLPLAIAYLLGRACIWHLIVRRVIGPHALYINLLSWLSSLAGKYLPGKVFLLVGRIYVYRNRGASAMQVSSCFLIEACCSALATIAVFGLAMLSRPSASFGSLKIGVAILAAALLIVTHPVVMRKLINTALRILRREPLELQFRWRDVLGWTLLMSLNWLVLGLGFYLLLHAVIDVPFELYLYLTGAFSVAGVIGVLAVFAPSGIGVREGVMAFVLAGVLTSGVAAVASLLARLWITVAEALCSGIALLLVYRTRAVAIVGESPPATTEAESPAAE